MNLEQMQIQVETLQAKQALHELVANYCTGVDRRDRVLLEALWWPEATMDFGVFVGPAAQFCELICADNPAMEISFHFTSNELFEIDGDQAVGRHYVIGMSSLLVDGVATQQLVGGRYLDKYARREGVWTFSKRLFVLDLNINQPSSAIWDKGIGAVVARGRATRDDVSYSFA